MTEAAPAPPTAQAPSVGFIGWGPENRSLLKVLATAHPGIEGTAPCFFPEGAAPPTAGLRTLPTVEALFSACDTIFVETSARAFEQALPLIRLVIADRHVLVLMGRGWKLGAALRQLNERKLVRCLIRPFPGERGALLAFYAATYLKATELSSFRELFGSLELVLELESERQFEVVLGLAELAPAAMFTIMDAMADGALMMGLPREPALKFIATVLLGSAQELIESGQHPAVLRESALESSSAAAGLMELETAGIRGLLMRAVREAMAELTAGPQPGKRGAEREKP